MDRLQHALWHLDGEAIASLDLSMFTADDLANIVLQRSEVIADQPRPHQAIRAWSNGDTGPVRRVVDQLGAEIAGRAAALVYMEYQDLRALLDRLAPARIADIGCGYAFFDHFAHRDLGQRIDLIDIEHTEHRHFRFQAEASGYASLAVARAFLEANGCPADRITATNPQRGPLPADGTVDLAVSFLSCGFHFPWTAYGDYLRTALRPGGSVILDLRRRTLAAAVAELAGLGAVVPLTEVSGGKGTRVHLRLSGGSTEGAKVA